MEIPTELLVILCLILANAIFAAAEIATITVRRTRLRELEAQGSGAARALVRMRERPESFLATVQIGITVVSATAAAFGGAKLGHELAVALARAGAGRYAENLALAAVVGLISYLSIVLGELVPKSLALRSSERYALLMARPMLGLSWLARPLVWFLTASSNAVLRLFNDKTTFTEARLSKEELQQLVDEASTAGDLDPKVGEIAYRALDFGDVRVGAVMVPRQEMVTLKLDATREEICQLLRGRAHSRIPVHRDSLDDIVGYVTSRDLVPLVTLDADRTVRDVLRKGFFVPESRLAAEVLKDMQRTRDQLALVVDEEGTVSGLVTMEDLLEELVGEIFAEHETPLERIRAEPDGNIVVRGQIPVHEINREMGIDLPEGPLWTTIGGLAMTLAGAMPKTGAILAAGHGMTLEVVDASERRVQLVRIRTPRPEAVRPRQR
jgi:putative hemolysin